MNLLQEVQMDSEEISEKSVLEETIELSEENK